MKHFALTLLAASCGLASCTLCAAAETDTVPPQRKEIRIEPLINPDSLAFDGSSCDFAQRGKKSAGTVVVYNSDEAWARIDGKQEKLGHGKTDVVESPGHDRIVSTFHSSTTTLVVNTRELKRGEGGFSAAGTVLVKKGGLTRQIDIVGGCAD